MRKLALVLMSILTLVLAGVAPGDALAEDRQDLAGYSAAGVEDLMQFAKSSAGTLAKAADRFRGLNQFYAIVDDLRSHVDDAPVEAVWLDGSASLIVAPSLELLTRELVAATKLSISVTVRDRRNPRSLELEIQPLEHAPEPQARGGFGYYDCTGGFTVKSGSTRGIATPHHCTTKPSSYN